MPTKPTTDPPVETPPADEPDKLAEALAAFSEIGARNNKTDAGTIQQMHDHAVELGAVCDPDNTPEEKAETPGEEAAEGTEPATAKESATVEVDGKQPIAQVQIHESSFDGGAVMVTLQEARAVFDDATQEVWITPIRPGFGNKRDGFYYPGTTLREAVKAGVFDGRKMFANHPRKSDEKERPERDVKDWIGVVKESVWDEARGVPRSRLKLLDEKVYAQFKAAPEHIAFSILGGGIARPGRVDGREARVVESLKNIHSIDWVTEAGAGGAIDFAESASEELDMELSELTIEQLREARPDLFDQAVALAEEDEAALNDEAADDEDAGGGDNVSNAGFDPEQFVSRAEFDELLVELHAAKKARAKEAASQVVEAAVRNTTLPASAKALVMSHFREATMGAEFLFPTTETLSQAVAREVEDVRRVVDEAKGRRPSAVEGLGTATTENVAEAKSLAALKESAIDSRMGKDALPTVDSRSTDAHGESLSESRGGSASSRVASGIAARI